MSTQDDAPKPLPTLDEETDIRPPPPPKASEVETILDPMALPGLGADLSAQLAANAEETEVETMVANADEAARMREEALTRALPAPPHPSGDQALKTKEQVAEEEEAAVQAMLKGEEPPAPKPPAPRETTDVAAPRDTALLVMLGMQGAWNVVSGIIWFVGIFTIPLGIACWILAFFEFKLLKQAVDGLDGKVFAEKTKTLSYWEMAALIYAGGIFTFLLGIIIQIRSRQVLAA
ncbi:MAG: hypothetical protein GY913_24400 [Proteobacteria bacterium]|nr:hypothetical protein [Pseudomonadota bacterium]MCP4920056.1 hypothetical protein [Pseudomonadota bacterium]